MIIVIMYKCIFSFFFDQFTCKRKYKISQTLGYYFSSRRPEQFHQKSSDVLVAKRDPRGIRPGGML